MTTHETTIGTGDRHYVDQTELIRRADEAARVMAAHQHSRRHLFVATVAYRIDPTMPIRALTADTLFTGPAIGCFICEQEYRPGMEHTRCPGDPTE